MIELKNITKSYGNRTVLNDFNLNVEEGKITCILGESGSGKTTLFNIIANLIDYQGSVVCPEVSYVFQTPNLFDNLTVKQNLELVCSSNAKIESLTKALGIFDRLNSYPKHLSGGEAQRVAICRGILFSKPLLLLDEPFASIDVMLRYSLIDEVKKQQKANKNTVLVVTHDVREAVALADRIIVLKHGKIVYDNSSVDTNTEAEVFNVLINAK